MGFVGTCPDFGGSHKLFEDISESALSYRCHMRNSSGSSLRKPVRNDNGQTDSKHTFQGSCRLIKKARIS